MIIEFHLNLNLTVCQAWPAVAGHLPVNTVCWTAESCQTWTREIHKVSYRVTHGHCTADRRWSTFSSGVFAVSYTVAHLRAFQ